MTNRTNSSLDDKSYGENEPQLTAELEHELTLFTRKAVWRLWTANYGEVRGLDRVTYPYLAVVSVRSSITVGDLAQLFRVDKSTASRHMAKLHDGGLVRVIDNPPDARSLPWEATESGRRQVAMMQADRAAWLHRVLAGWGEQERRELARLVAKLNADLDALDGPP